MAYPKLPQPAGGLLGALTAIAIVAVLFLLLFFRHRH